MHLKQISQLTGAKITLDSKVDTIIKFVYRGEKKIETNLKFKMSLFSKIRFVSLLVFSKVNK